MVSPAPPAISANVNAPSLTRALNITKGNKRIPPSGGTRTTYRRVRAKRVSTCQSKSDGPSHKSQETKNRKSRLRPGRLFAITLGLPDVYPTVREDFIESFAHLTSYCCSLERSNKSGQVSNHLHAFLEFDHDVLLTNIREFISIAFPECHLDIQSCKSRKSWLVYITKEDVHAYSNIKSSNFHLNYRLYEWAIRTPYFSFCDPFVVEHRFCYRFIQSYHAELHGLKYTPPLKIIEYSYEGWPLACAIWWNNRIINYKRKSPCLFVHGPGNVGKSTYIEKLIGRSNMNSVYYPPPSGNFFMGDYNSQYHKVIIFEEFNLESYPIPALKRLLEGAPYSFPRKCLPSVNLVHTGPIIFISNEYVSSFDQAFLNRFLFVSAEVPYWTLSKVPIPKIKLEEEETLSSGHEEEEILLSSSQESTQN